MRKSTNFKALYRFTKEHKLKDSTSTKDPEDSLDAPCTQLHARSPHLRTQSCPEPPPQPSAPKSPLRQGKAAHPIYHSQPSLYTLSQS